MDNIIKVGFLASYDYRLLYHALPLVYEAADEITIAIDKHRRTWSGSVFLVDESIFDWLTSFDSKHKIRVFEGDFYQDGLSPMENETRERNLLAGFMGEGGWHVQLDADEYFCDFEKFTDFLKNRADSYLQYPEEKACVYSTLTTLFKRVEDGFLYIPLPEPGPVATRQPHYEKARYNGGGRLLTNFAVIHQSWARTDEEIWEKLSNWGHRDDFNTASYYKFWSACDAHNYKFYHDFHPLTPASWKNLAYIESANIEEFITKYSLLEKLDEQPADGTFHPLHVLKKERKKKSWFKKAFGN